MKIYELEQKIMATWQTGTDVELLYQMYLDRETPMTEDEVSNILLGIVSLHNLRMEDLWYSFEKVLAERHNK